MRELKDLIKDRRLEIGKTLEQVGKEVGVAKATVQRWESGEIKDMRKNKLVLLAKALQTTPAYLMGWEDKQKEASLLSKEDLDPLNKELIEMLPHLSLDQRKLLVAMIKAMLEQE